MLRKIFTLTLFFAGCIFVTGCNNNTTTNIKAKTSTTDNRKPTSSISNDVSDPIISTTESSYVFASSDGLDTGDGTAFDPYSLKKAIEKMKTGSTIYLISGTYEIESGLTLSTAGSEKHPNSLVALGEGAVFDFKGNSGLTISGSYWLLYNISFTNCFVNSNLKGACTIVGNGNIIEYCKAYNNRAHGFCLSESASDNEIVNCTSKFNKYGGGTASGYYLSGSGTGNMLNSCLSFRNEDSGYDVTITKQIVFLDCLAIQNGIFEDGTNNDDTAGTKAGFAFYDKTHVFENCTSSENEYGFYAKGNNNGSFKINNSSAINNKIRNYRLYDGSEPKTTMELENVLSYNTTGVAYQDEISGYCKNSLFFISDKYYYTGDKSVLIDSRDSENRGTQVVSTSFEIDMTMPDPFDIIGKKTIEIGTYLNRDEEFQDNITAIYFGAKY